VKKKKLSLKREERKCLSQHQGKGKAEAAKLLLAYQTQRARALGEEKGNCRGSKRKRTSDRTSPTRKNSQRKENWKKSRSKAILQTIFRRLGKGKNEKKGLMFKGEKKEVEIDGKGIRGCLLRSSRD